MLIAAAGRWDGVSTRRLAAGLAGAFGLGAVGAIIGLLFVDTVAQLIGGVLICGVAAAGYGVWSYRRPQALLALGAIVVAAVACIIAAENVILADNVFHSDFTKRLILDAQRERRVAMSLRHPDVSFERFGADRLFYRHTPASRFRETYDGADRPYEVVVDEIGFLNPPGRHSLVGARPGCRRRSDHCMLQELRDRFGRVAVLHVKADQMRPLHGQGGCGLVGH